VAALTQRTHPLASGRPSAGEGEDDLATEQAVELLREKEQLEQAMHSRPVIDMARRVLMVGLSCREDEAWEVLVSVSRHANVKVREVAEAVTWPGRERHPRRRCSWRRRRAQHRASANDPPRTLSESPLPPQCDHSRQVSPEHHVDLRFCQPASAAQ